ncbi:MAG: TonB-dependent receptor [Prevotella sp.]|nr:TonB-dependent receptor [Prevotella sp.]
MKQVKFRMPLRMLALVCGLILSVGAFAQQITVNGNVKDATGEAVIGATVRVAGQSAGTITDFDGNFTLKAQRGAQITVSYVGYKDATAVAAPTVSIIMQDDAQMLNDVVVIGYGTVRKSDATGSVVTVEADQLTKGLATSPADLLQGKSPGVTITNNGGAPGAGSTIRIRGGSSLSASNDPLIVIDGLPISGTGISGSSDVLSTINPNDIESFSVLKDASATAIYGSRASNGVIVITTKKGKGGKPTVNVDLTGSFQTMTDYVDVMNAQEFTDAFNRQLNSGTLTADQIARAQGIVLRGADTDWQKEIYRKAWTEEINASVAGGINGKKDGLFNGMPYRVSAGFINNDGVLKQTNMKRITGSINLTPKFFDERLTLNLNAKGVYTKNNFGEQGAIGAAVTYNPTSPIYSTEAGKSLNGYSEWMSPENPTLVNSMASINPISMMEDYENIAKIKRFVGNAQFDYKFKYVPGLRANLNLGLDISSSDGHNDVKAGSFRSMKDTNENGSGSHNEYSQTRRDQSLEFYLNYARELPSIESRFDVMGGYSWQHFYNGTNSQKWTADLSQSLSVYDNATESYLVSFFGRLNYTLMDRYLLTATMRRDGSSKFANNHWGLFPALAFAWRVSEEPFMRDLEHLSNFKIRLGWGKTGQQSVGGDYPALPVYKTNLIGSYYMFGNSILVPISPLAYAADLKWETTTTYNIGFDFGFFRDRINGSVDFYKRDTKDLLNYAPVALGSNLNNWLTQNVGDMTNIGFEVALNVVPVETKDWHWEVGFNASYNENEITKLTLNDDPTYIGALTGGISGGVGNTIQINKVGYPANSFWVYEQVYDQNGNPIEGQYVDRNGDGQVNDDDLYAYKDPAPNWTLGLNTTLSWKKWTISASARANFNNYVYNNVASNAEMLADLWTNDFASNRVLSALDSNFGQAQYKSDYYVHNASFFKLDKVTLAYDAFKWLRVHATVQNVCTITKYKGLDPEVFSGIDNNMYPRPLTVLVGASLKF